MIRQNSLRWTALRKTDVKVTKALFTRAFRKSFPLEFVEQAPINQVSGLFSVFPERRL
jgi:hypothetical protein